MTPAGYFRRRGVLATGAVLAVVLGAIALLVALLLPAFEASLAPQALDKARTAARSLADTVGHGAALDIPLERLVGVDELLAQAAARNPEFAHLELRGAGSALAAYGAPAPAGALQVSVPVPGYELARAEIAIAIDPGYLRGQLREIAMDLAVVAVVALFVSLELLYLLAGGLLADAARLRAQLAAFARGAFVELPPPAWLGARLGAALEARRAALAAAYAEAVAGAAAAFRERAQRGREAARPRVRALRELRSHAIFEDRRGSRGSQEAALMLGAMRAPFFLLLLADDLSRSFLPVFAAGLPNGGLALSPELVASLPVSVFLLVVALSQPVMGGWSERIGHRRSFLAAAAIALAAHLASALAPSLPLLLSSRAVGGAAWAIAFVAAQGYVLDHTDARTRTAGLAAFVGIIMVSLACGPSIGGILADGLGYRPTLLAAAVFAAVALALAWRRLPADPPTAAQAPVRLKLARALANRRFLALLIFAAVPAKLILIAYCYYLIPLYIVDRGSTSAMAGRLIMLYSVMMVLLVPAMARWAVVLRARRAMQPEAPFVAAGLALSGIAGLAMALPLGLAAPLLVVLLLGLGQSLSISPQAAMVAEICADEIRVLGQGAVYGVYRLVERLGNAAGPLVGAALLAAMDFEGAFVAIGAAVLACALLFALVFLPRPAAAEPAP